MLSSMSERLLDGIRAACVAHGLGAERAGELIRVQDGLEIAPRVYDRGAAHGSVQVQVDFAIQSPRLAGVPFLDSFAGVGANPDVAEHNAFEKFLQGSFYVLVESLTTHRCDSAPVEWEQWAGAGHGWRVCAGPLFLLATRSGARIEGFPEFFGALTELFRARMSAGPHWMRVFVGGLDGGHMGSEVLVDGQIWSPGQALLDAHAWTYPPGYASLRHLLVSLPAV